MDYAENVLRIQSLVAAACERSGRDPSSVELMAVSKGQPPDAVRAVASSGIRLFGENKVQEGRAKIPLCPGTLRWHMIGHLQSNKCRDAVMFFQMIQGVDSLEIAEDINRWAEKLSRRVAVLLEVNTAGEASKYGFKPGEVPDAVMAVNAFPRLELHGLMTIAPYSLEAERVRPFFRKLREVREASEQRLGASLPVLSMGMSGDFEVAIEEGATLVRIGTALFGARPKKTPVG